MALKGGIITRRPLSWLEDGKVFFAPCGREIRVYSATSAEHINTLTGHTAAVTSVALDPASSTRVRVGGWCRRCCRRFFFVLQWRAFWPQPSF